MRTRRWIHPSSFSRPFLQLPRVSQTRRRSRLSRDVDRIEMARGNVADERKREKETERKWERQRENLCILALPLFAAIYFMIHTRALTATGLHTDERGPRYCVPGRVEKCDILWQMDGGGSWQRCTFKCDCLFRARLPANTNLWCSAGLSLLAATSRRS